MFAFECKICRKITTYNMGMITIEITRVVTSNKEGGEVELDGSSKIASVVSVILILGCGSEENKAI